MSKYISMIRGITVSGQKNIKMDDLTILFEELGFEYVLTYIQSGNVIFCSQINDTDEIKLLIQNKIYEYYNFYVTVIILRKKELLGIVSKIPFDKAKINLKKSISVS